MFNFKRRSLLATFSITLLVALFFVLPASAQDVLRVSDASLFGLPGSNLGNLEGVRAIIVRVIQIILGFLGLVAVAVMIYGGYVWMTSAGNSDRVTRAKAILVNGLIGLVLVLASYAIVAFIVRTFVDVVENPGNEICTQGELDRPCGTCGGTQSCEDPDLDGIFNWGNCNGPTLCPNEAVFSLVSYTPTGNDNPINSEVRMRFKKDVEDITPPSVQDHFTVTATDQATNNVSEISGVISYFTDNEGNDIKYRLVFTPDNPCALDPSQRCFPENSIINVTIQSGLAGLQSVDGDSLVCNGDCSWDFGVGDGFDADSPVVSLVSPRRYVARLPDPNDSRPGANMSLLGRDDFKIANAGFRVSDGVVLGHIPGQPLESPDFTPSSSLPRQINASALWDTSSLQIRSQHTVTAWVNDVAGRGPVEITETVTVVAAHCLNRVQDADETDIDCGGADCDVCNSPIITRIEPADASPGDYVTIKGRYFGDNVGTVTFSGPNQVFEVPAVDDEIGLTPTECIGIDTWTNNQIIIQLPDFDIDADNDGNLDTEYIFDTHVSVSDNEGNEGNTLHWNNLPLTVNTAVERPSLCGIDPIEIRQCDTGEDRLVELTGRKFGGDAVNPGNVLFGDREGNIDSWSSVPSVVSASVPSIRASTFGTRIENTENKYCVGGLNAWATCNDNTGCSSGVCEYAKSNPVDFTVISCVPQPVVTGIDPSSGPNNQIVTISGRHFGSSPREVLFVDRNTGDEVRAQFEFPDQCGPTDYWGDNQIIAKVPNAGTPPNGLGVGNYDVIVRLTSDGQPNESDPFPFEINNNPLKPGLVCAIPNNGPAEIEVELIGEAFGDPAQQGAVVFTSNAFGDIDTWSSTVIETKVPEFATSGPLFMVRQDGQNSNSIGFTVGSCSIGGCASGQVCCGDGSCRASAELCAVPPSPPLSSYRWRVTTGDPAPRVVEQAQCLVNLVRNWSFENYDEDTNLPNDWNVSGVLGEVEVLTGSRSAVLKANQSGQIVQNINAPFREGESLVVQLSAKGTELTTITLLAIDTASGLGYLQQVFTLDADDVWQDFTAAGLVPFDIESTELRIILPQDVLIDDLVIQSSSAETATTQSPSPYRGTRDACTNSALSLRFTTEVSDLGELKLAECKDNSRSCGEVENEIVVGSTSLGVDGLVAAGATLKPDQWYKATISGVKSDQGVEMLAPYVWTFKTGDGACAIGGSSCSPNRVTLTSSIGPTSSANLSASLQALNCNILSCATGDIDWQKSPDSDDATQFGAVGVCSVPVSVKLPPNEGTDFIRPEVATNPSAVVGMCRVDIEFAPLRVVGVYPQCNNACLNTKPVVAFSVPVQTLIFPDWGTSGVLDPSIPHYSVEECDDSVCTNSIDISNSTVLVEHNFTEEDLRGLNLPTDAGQYFVLESNWTLNNNKFYRITLFGGEDGILSVDDKELPEDYTWIFGTGSSQCLVDRVSLYPEEVTVDIIGSEVDYSVSAFSSPDECAPRGQLLDAGDYAYNWSSADVQVATISASDNNPPTGADSEQVATAVGQSPACVSGDSTCTTTLTTTELITSELDTSTFTLQCGFTPAGACRVFDENLLTNGSFERGYTPQFGDEDGWASSTGATHRILFEDPVDRDGYLLTQTSNDLLITDFQTSKPLDESVLDLRFFARYGTDVDPNDLPALPNFQVYLGNVLTTVNFSFTSSPQLNFDWQEYRAVADLRTSLDSFDQASLWITVDGELELDGISVSERGCTNNPDRSCVTTNECNIDSNGNDLNTCGVGGNPDGVCDPGTGLCNNSATPLSCTTDADCRLAVNPGGCCGLRPYVTNLEFASYPDGTENFICTNSGIEVDFSTLMDANSFNNNVRLEWKDTTPGGAECVIDEEPGLAIGFFQKIFAFIKGIFGLDAQATDAGKWCGVPISTTVRTMYNEITNRPEFSRLTVYPEQLLSDNLQYRLIIEGETVDDPLGGVRNIYSIPMLENRSGYDLDGNFRQFLSYRTATSPTEHSKQEPNSQTILFIGDRICEIDRVEIDILPPLPQDSTIISTPLQPRDLFQCVGNECFCSSDPSDPAVPGAAPGEPGCRITSDGPKDEDSVKDTSAPGAQHVYIARALTIDNQVLSSDFAWSTESPSYLPINLSVNDSAITNVTLNPTPEVRYGLAKVNVSASPKNLSVSGATNTVNVIFDRCNNPWDTPLVDNDSNFQTTYCLDFGKDNEKTDDLPEFGLSPFGAPTVNPLEIRNEWILKHESNADAIAFRVVQNKLHLTPLEWYNEQAFEKGSPQIIDGGIDGYPAIRDGRTAYIGFGNVVGTDLFTNILIVSHSQNAGEDTVEVFNRLLNNLTFNINKLSVGQCRSTLTLQCDKNSGDLVGNECTENINCDDGAGNVGACKPALEGRGCLIDNDCNSGFVCSSAKSAIIRDVDRFTKLLDIQSYLVDYRYGTSCPRVTPGAPGDADCNGVINGQDIIRASEIANGASTICDGADYNLSGSVTQTDVGSIQQLVQQNCTRSGNLFTNYPSLNEGTFVENMTTSVWPSWQETLGNQLRQSLPIDPINLFSQCGVSGLSQPQINALPHSPYTCWDPNSKTYASYNAQKNTSTGAVTGNAVDTAGDPWIPDVPQGLPNLGTHVFTYASYDNGRDYALCTYLESGAVPTPSAVGQNTGSASRLCVLSASGLSLPPAPPANTLQSGSNLQPIPNGSVINLTMTGGGTGKVTMSYTNGESIDCNKGSLRSVNCVLIAKDGEIVTLKVDGVATNYVWSQNCPVDAGNNCEFEADLPLYNVNVSVSSNATLSLTEAKQGTFTPSPAVSYTVSRNGSATSCNPLNTCSFSVGDTISISPTIGTNTRFVSWNANSPCAGQGANCSFVIEENTTLTFTIQERKKVLLTEIVSTGGQFGGTIEGELSSVSGSPIVILNDCDSDLGTSNTQFGQACREIDLIKEDERVILTATPNSGRVTVWEGCNTFTGNSCEVVMTRDKTVRVRFVSGEAQLTIDKIGDDRSSVTTVSSTTPALNCPAGCGEATQAYPDGTQITLRAEPATGAVFEEWGGAAQDCSNNQTCTITVSGTITVTATFSVPKASITIARSPIGGGTVSVSQAIGKSSCGPADPASGCKITVPANIPFTISASAGSGYSFTNYQTTDSQLSTCHQSTQSSCSVSGGLSENSNATITATFATQQIRLNVTKTTDEGGDGTYTFSPPGIDPTSAIPPLPACEASFDSCKAFNPGETVTITANPDPGTTVQFNGCTPVQGNSNSCTVEMTSQRNVTIAFNKIKHNLTIQNSGPGSVEVRAGGVLVDTVVGTQTKVVAVDEGVNVVLKPVANTGSTHLRWGDDTADTCYGTAGGSDCVLSAVNSTNPTNKTIESVFVGNTTLTINKDGAGEGRITQISYFGGPSGLSCNTFPCSISDIPQGVDVTITAAANTGFALTKLQNCTVGTLNKNTGTCTTTMTSSKNVIVTFNAPPIATVPTVISVPENDQARYTFPIPVTDPDNDNWWLTALPTANQPGTISGCIANTSLPVINCHFEPDNPEFNGDVIISYTVQDVTTATPSTPSVGINDPVSAQLTLRVTPTNDPPVIELTKCSTPATNSAGLGFVDDCLNSLGVKDGQVMELYCQANDPDGDTLVYEWVQTSTRGLGTGIPNSSNPSVSVPIRADVGVTNVGTVKSSVLSNTAQSGISSVSYNIDSTANALVVTYHRTPTTPSPISDTNVWWPESISWQSTSGTEVVLKRISASGNGGNSIAGIAVYYWGPGVVGFTSLPTGSGNIRVKNHISSQISGTHAISIATFNGVVGVGVSNAVNSSSASGTGDEILNISLSPLSSSVLVGGFVMKNTNADTIISGAQQLSDIDTTSGSGAAQMRYGFLSATSNSVDIGSSGTNTNQISYGLGFIELQREVLVEYNTSYQCKVTDPSGLSDIEPSLPGVEITRLLP